MGKTFLPEQRFTYCKIFTTLLFCVFLSSLPTACTQHPGKAGAGGQGIVRHYVQEPFTLTLQTSRKEMTIAEQLKLELTAEVPENITVEFPSYKASLGDFTLKGTRKSPVRMVGTGNAVRIIHRVTYILEPYLAGNYTIPAMTVTFSGGSDGTGIRQIVTDKIDIAVASLMGPDSDPRLLKDIKEPQSMPLDTARLLLMFGMLLLLVILAVGVSFWWKKTSAGKVPPTAPPDPEAIALQELDRLLAENLLARGEIKLFHLRISDILRRYIENRFGLRAPEQTTEEFLLELSRAASSPDAPLGRHKTLLSSFLHQCDLVKFARHEPAVAESEKILVLCQEFIKKTSPKSETTTTASLKP